MFVRSLQKTLATFNSGLLYRLAPFNSGLDWHLSIQVFCQDPCFPIRVIAKFTL